MNQNTAWKFNQTSIIHGRLYQFITAISSWLPEQNNTNNNNAIILYSYYNLVPQKVSTVLITANFSTNFGVRHSSNYLKHCQMSLYLKSCTLYSLLTTRCTQPEKRLLQSFLTNRFHRFSLPYSSGTFEAQVVHPVHSCVGDLVDPRHAFSWRKEQQTHITTNQNERVN